MKIIDKDKKTVKNVDPHYRELCDEAFINLSDALKMRLTEDDLLKFICKSRSELW